jgi:4a-hydroxytetrahydrobiopterin dehydratase
LAILAARGEDDLVSRPARLDDAELTAGLARVPDWRRDGEVIRRSIETPSFADAIALVTRIGFAAEAADHHPDLDVRWRTVHVALTTHDAGGLTRLDLELAAAIDAAARGVGA